MPTPPRPHPVLIALAAGLVVICTAGLPGAQLERPMSLTIQTRDGQSYAGKMTAFDEQGFTLVDREDATHQIEWARVHPRRVYDMHTRLLGDTDADAWLALGVRLREMDSGMTVSDAAFGRAVRIAPALQEKVDRIKQGLPPEPEPEPTEHDHAESVAHPGDEAATAGPQVVGHTQADFWGDLSPELMASSVEELKGFAKEAGQKLGARLTLHETANFLFYSDLTAGDAAFWASQLEAMYDKLCFMFDLDKSKNIFRGKCLIFVFRNEGDYHRFQAEMHQTTSVGTAGMCHGYGNGYVHVAFYRQPDTWSFAHVLVHESVHGFLHRYRSPRHIPSWANEGLAETISVALVPKATSNAYRAAIARKEMKMRGNLGGMFDARQIESWQYGVARLLTDFMIAQDKKRYAAFINGIKDAPHDEDWRKSLEQNYGVTLERLVNAFGEIEGVRGLRP